MGRFQTDEISGVRRAKPVGQRLPLNPVLQSTAAARCLRSIYSAGVTTYYLYDGWNLIAEYTGIVLEKTYTWGMDLSGSMQGAGGVGGLLAVDDQVDIYYPTYDGNGNVSEYLNAAGAVQAHYEYDAFGNTTVSTGSKKDDLLHRFSTKPLDAESGLYYYGYRYYDPVTGRWPSRDPIGQRGGINLYGMVGNDGVGGVDVLGLEVLIIGDPSSSSPDDPNGNLEITVEPENLCGDGAGSLKVSFKITTLTMRVSQEGADSSGRLIVGGSPIPVTKVNDTGPKSTEFSAETMIFLPECPVYPAAGTLVVQIEDSNAVDMGNDDPLDNYTGIYESFEIKWSYKCKKRSGVWLYENCCEEDVPFSYRVKRVEKDYVGKNIPKPVPKPDWRSVIYNK